MVSDSVIPVYFSSAEVIHTLLLFLHEKSITNEHVEIVLTLFTSTQRLDTAAAAADISFTASSRTAWSRSMLASPATSLNSV